MRAFCTCGVTVANLLRAAIVVVALCAGTVSAAAPAWPGWRGPRGDGHSTESDLPSQWSKTSIAWSVDLPGHGQSSPKIWGLRIFLTASLFILAAIAVTHKGCLIDFNLLYCDSRIAGNLV